MKRLYILLLCMAFVVQAFSAVFSGKVTDVNGEPVSFASLFCRKTGQGITADLGGCFRMELENGVYVFEVSALGYCMQEVETDLTAGDCNISVVLEERIYRLDEVNISGRDEDPAYAVMRRVVASAPRNRAAVAGYRAEAYTKGSGKIKDLPGLLKAVPGYDKEMKPYLDRLYVLENVSEVHFTCPDKYDVRVKAATSSFPDSLNIDNVLAPANIDVYGDQLMGCVSPVGRKAFAYYRFRLEGYYEENGRMVNKIMVIPKVRAANTLGGWLYVVEDLWCISDMDLDISQSMGDIAFTVNCKEIRDGIFLPSSSSVGMNLSFMGVKMHVSLFSSMSYSEVIPGRGMSAAAHAPEKPLPADKQKVQRQIEKILAKEELTTRDAVKLARLSEKMNDSGRKDTLGWEKRFDIEAASGRRVQVDSLALMRDSAYWSRFRSVPLLDEELQSYARKKGSTGRDTISFSDMEDMTVTLMTGKKFYNNDRNKWIRTPGLLSVYRDANTVDGFNLGLDFSLGMETAAGREFSVTPWAGYLTGRQDVNYGGEMKLEYSPRRNGIFLVEGGRVTSDFNGECGMNRYLNSVMTYLFAVNDVKFYENRFARISNEVDLANGLRLSADVSYTRRFNLDNYTTRLGRRNLSPNIPASPYYEPMPDSRMLHFGASLEFTPAKYYFMNGERKVYTHSKSPTFSIGYRHGMSVWGASSRYNRVEAGIRQNVQFLFSSLSYNVQGGMFFRSHNVAFPDFRHFSASDIYLSAGGMNDSFALLDGYALSTSSEWVQAFLTYDSQRLLLKWLPFLSRKLATEAIHLRALYVKDAPVHSEAGYSLGLGGLMRAGVFVSFTGARYESVGFVLSIPLKFY